MKQSKRENLIHLVNFKIFLQFERREFKSIQVQMLRKRRSAEKPEEEGTGHVTSLIFSQYYVILLHFFIK